MLLKSSGFIGIIFALLGFMSSKQIKIFLVDSDPTELRDKINFNAAIYYPDKRDNAIKEAKQVEPDLFIGNFWGENCEEMVSKIRNDSQLSNKPIILLTDKKSICRVIRQVNGSVNDYMVKPLFAEEVQARIDRVLTMHYNLMDTNPLSHLPGNYSIKREITQRLESKIPFSILYLDLDNFKAFNDFYGYIRGDQIIKFIANVIQDSVIQKNISKHDSFVGHIGGDDFIVICSINNLTKIENLCEEILCDFDKKIASYYDKKDQDNGFIQIKDRQNKSRKFNLISLTIAGININKNMMDKIHPGEISSRGAEIKHYLKKQTGSNYLIDRRLPS